MAGRTLGLRIAWPIRARLVCGIILFNMQPKVRAICFTAFAAFLATGCSESGKDPFAFSYTTTLSSVVTMDLTSCTQGSPPTVIEVRMDFDTNNVEHSSGAKFTFIADGIERSALVQAVRIEDGTPPVSTDNDLSFLTSFIVQPIGGFLSQPAGSTAPPLLVSLSSTPSPWFPTIRLEASGKDIVGFVSTGSNPFGQADLPFALLPMKISGGLDCMRALALRGNPPSLASFTVIFDIIVKGRTSGPIS